MRSRWWILVLAVMAFPCTLHAQGAAPQVVKYQATLSTVKYDYGVAKPVARLAPGDVLDTNPLAGIGPVKVDRKLKDGDKIELGGTVITAHHHPGHTKGATSFTLDVREAGKTYRVGIMNMASINPGVKVSGMPMFPGITEAYARTFHDQKEMKIDVWLASHAAQFGLHDKYKPGDPYNPERFVDPMGYHAAVEKLEKTYQDQLAAERAGK